MVMKLQQGEVRLYNSISLFHHELFSNCRKYLSLCDPLFFLFFFHLFVWVGLGGGESREKGETERRFSMLRTTKFHFYYISFGVSES